MACAVAQHVLPYGEAARVYCACQVTPQQRLDLINRPLFCALRFPACLWPAERMAREAAERYEKTAVVLAVVMAWSDQRTQISCLHKEVLQLTLELFAC